MKKVNREGPNMPITVRALRDDLPFGATISGVTDDALQDETVREEITQAFDERGLIVFAEVEPTNRLQVAISKVFGPLKEHPVKAVDLVDPETMAGAIENRLEPESCDIVEIDGKLFSNWLPWHFDHCYNNELNRAGVLRVTLIPPHGGLTGFMDGVELYKLMPAQLREWIEGRSIVYSMDMQFDHIRFGRPENFRLVQLDPHMLEIFEQSKTYPRAIHPVVWTRETGEKVFHLSPWMAEGVEGQENAQGDAMLEAISREMIRLCEAHGYFHHWKPTDMVVWDNWRMMHRVTGVHPPHARTIQRTTIKGDYGLGRFEENREVERAI
jgi:taurine dioxygenase